jgi:uncharacterized protein with PIN domain
MPNEAPERKKFQRRLGKKCSQCGGTLQSFSKTTFSGGIQYEESVSECTDCGFVDKNKSNKSHTDKDLY